MGNQKNRSLTAVLGWTSLFLIVFCALGYFFMIHPLIDSDMARYQSRPKAVLKTLPSLQKDPLASLVSSDQGQLQEESGVGDNGVVSEPITPSTHLSKDRLDPLEGLIQQTEHLESKITGHVLQVGSFTRLERANKEKQNLEEKGFDVRIQIGQVNSVTYYRVQVVGDFADYSKLQQTKKRLNEASISFIEKDEN